MLFKVEWLIAGFGTLPAVDLGLAMIPLMSLHLLLDGQELVTHGARVLVFFK